jgi:hypothetical protein
MEEDKNKTTTNTLENQSSDTIPSFLLKTYEILEVIAHLLRMTNTLTSYVGQKMGKGSLLRRSSSFLKTFYQYISGITTILPSSDRLILNYSAQHV